MKRILLLFTLLLLPFCLNADQTSPVTHVDPTAAAKLLASEKNPTVLDIRTAEEFTAGHIEGAKNIDFFKATFAEKLGKLDKTHPYLVHCKSGGRSGKSLAIFKKLGFEKIYHLDGGILAWQKAEQKIVK